MGEDQETKVSESDSELVRQIREGRKFTLEDAIARLAGPGAMKGESPVARMQQAEIEIESWLRTHLTDGGGALEAVLNRQVKRSDQLLNNFGQPLVVLASFCKDVLNSDFRLEELVRAADFEWGRMMGERPYFANKGAASHPDDPYTCDSVRKQLTDVLNQLAAREYPEHSE
jgi:hypothetical protein